MSFKLAASALSRFRPATLFASSLLALLLAACSGDIDAPGEALRLLGGNLPEAFVGEAYSESLRPSGGLRPFAFEVSSGALPGGLALEQGVIRGTPDAAGSFTFTVTLSDANLSKTFLEHRLLVSEVPPPRLLITIPNTEIRSPVTVRVGVADARELQGLRTRLRWNSDLFELVPGSLRSVASGAVLFDGVGSDWLQVDLAWLARTQSGERQLFTFQLAPLDTAVLGLVADTEFALQQPGDFHFAASTAGVRVPVRSELPAAGNASTRSGDVPDDSSSDAGSGSGETEGDAQ